MITIPVFVILMTGVGNDLSVWFPCCFSPRFGRGGFSRFGGDDGEGAGMTNPVYEDYGAGGGVSCSGHC